MPKIGIWGKLFFLLFFIGSFSVGITLYSNIQEAGDALRDEALNHLISIRDIKKKQIENYFAERMALLNFLSNFKT